MAVRSFSWSGQGWISIHLMAYRDIVIFPDDCIWTFHRMWICIDPVNTYHRKHPLCEMRAGTKDVGREIFHQLLLMHPTQPIPASRDVKCWNATFILCSRMTCAWTWRYVYHYTYRIYAWRLIRERHVLTSLHHGCQQTKGENLILKIWHARTKRDARTHRCTGDTSDIDLIWNACIGCKV